MAKNSVKRGMWAASLSKSARCYQLAHVAQRLAKQHMKRRRRRRHGIAALMRQWLALSPGASATTLIKTLYGNKLRKRSWHIAQTVRGALQREYLLTQIA